MVGVLVIICTVSRSDSASDVDVYALVYSSVCWTFHVSAIMCVGVTSDV